MRTRVKICCISSVEEAALAASAGADAIGLVAAMPSGPGTILDQQITEIAATIPPPVARFLLTAETSGGSIAAHVQKTHCCTVQAVSTIRPAAWVDVGRLAPSVRRVQVVHVESREIFKCLDEYAPLVHAFLLDSGRPNAAVPELGGTGRTHDWKLSRAFVGRSPVPVFLAGGLTSRNVGEAIHEVRPFGVDVCSGVRKEGKLDPQRLVAFLAAVQAADASAHRAIPA